MTKLPKKAHYRPIEVAEYFNISLRSVYYHMERGALLSVEIGGCKRIPYEEIRRVENEGISLAGREERP